MRGLALMLACILAPGALAAGEEREVVVLPFVTADEELVIYGKPVADAVARGLTRRGAPAVVGAAAGPDLSVELRARRAKRKVQVEAILRDAAGATLTKVTGRKTSLADLDVAAAELARKLEAPIAAARRHAVPPPPTPAPTPAPAPPPPAPAPPPRDPRPTVVVYLPVAANPGPVIVGTLGTTAVVNLLSTLGFRAIISSSSGVVPAEVAAGSAARAGARATLMLYVYDIVFEPREVLTARGTMRLIAVGPDRRVLFDRLLETDTVVGGRGDDHHAVARFVLGQAMEMARRDLGRVLR
jgi:hypothetical protein